MNPQLIGPFLALVAGLTVMTLVFSGILYFCPTAFDGFLAKWHSLKPSKKLVVIGIIAGITAYAGTKHPSGGGDPTGGSSTNDVTVVEGDSTNDVSVAEGDWTNNVNVVEWDATNAPPDSVGGEITNEVVVIEGDTANGGDASTPTNNPPPLLMMGRPHPMMSVPPQPTTDNPQLTTNVPWHVRGAYCDWIHVDFPDGFVFPTGTNLLTRVTVLAWGEIRANLQSTPTPSIYTLPSPVSLEPDVSTFAHGLTASNSYLFVWENVCAEREATNRVNAAIELFRNGSMAITVTPLSTPTPPTSTYIPAVPPEGFIGEGQDTNWLASAFSPADYAAITNKGYARWLDEDFVGYNEENGHCRGTVTVHSMPPNGEPCYLVCGPYKVVVTEPGDYDFPIQVLTDYYIRTYPTAVPVSFTYDEGYYPDEDVYGPLMSGAPNRPMLLGATPPTGFHAFVIPVVYLSPYIVETMTHHVTIWCNLAQAAWEYVTLGEDVARLNFINRHEIEVRDRNILKSATYLIRDLGHPEVFGQLDLLRSYLYPDPNPTNGTYEGHSDTNGTYAGGSDTNGTQTAGEP